MFMIKYGFMAIKFLFFEVGHKTNYIYIFKKYIFQIKNKILEKY